MAEIKDRFREEINELVNPAWRGVRDAGIPKLADQILSIKIDDRYELTMVDRKAEPHRYTSMLLSEDYRRGAQHAQQDMLKAGWVKEVK